MSAKLVEGIFLPLSPDILSALYDVIEREGYKGDPQGIALFLTDVAGGKLDGAEEAAESGDLQGKMVNLAKEYGPSIAKTLGAMLRSGRG